MTFLDSSQHLFDEETGLYNIKTDKNRKWDNIQSNSFKAKTSLILYN